MNFINQQLFLNELEKLLYSMKILLIWENFFSFKQIFSRYPLQIFFLI